MSCSTEYQLSDGRLVVKKLLCLLLMLCGCSSGKTDGQIRNLQCFNDYDKKMDCTWEATNLDTTCANRYRMIYEREIVALEYNTCIPENVKIDGFIVADKCVCTVTVAQFNAGDEYLIQIQSFGKILANKTICPFNTIKPKTPGNLTVEYNKNGDPILHWDKKYRKEEVICHYLKFEIFYYNKEDPSKKYIVLHDRMESRFEISRSQLTLGGYYVAKIRAKPQGYYEGIWSDYSSEIEFRNDRTNNFVYESIPLIGGLTCIVIVVLIVMLYFCICMIKQKCDMIPDPSKSSLHFAFIGKSQVAETPLVYGHSSSDRQKWCHLKVTCWSWLGRFAPSLINQDVLQNPASQPTRKPSVDNSLRESKPIYVNTLTESAILIPPIILVPEKALFEPCVILSRPNDIDKTPAEEMNLQDEDRKESADSNNLFLDPSLNAMFLDMLNIPMCPQENSVIVVDEYKPCNDLRTENSLQSKTSSDCIGSFSFFTGTSDEGSCERTVHTMAQTPASSDSGYRSFESEVGNLDPDQQPHLDHLLCSSGCSETQANFLTSNENVQNEGASEFSSVLLEKCVDTSELNFDHQYRSFSSAILQSENNLEDDFAFHDSPSSVNCPLICGTVQTQGSSTSQQFFRNVVGLDFSCLSHQNDNHHAIPSLKFAEDSFLMANCDSCLTEMDISTAGIDSTASFNIPGYQSFENAIGHEKVPEGRNEDHFPLDYSSNDHTVGEHKEKIPNEMLFWDTEIQAEEPFGHSLQTSLVHLNTEVSDNTVHWGDCYSQDLGKEMDGELSDCVFPFVFDNTSIKEQCLAYTQDQKTGLGPIICFDQSFDTGTSSNSDQRIMNVNSNGTSDTLTENNIDEHSNSSGNTRKAYLLESPSNGQISLINNLSKDTEDAHPQNVDFVRILPKESVNRSITGAFIQEISTCHKPAEDNFSFAAASLKGTLLKYKNTPYFIKVKDPKTTPFLKENHLITPAEKKEIKNEIVKLNEALDVDGNSYMTVTELNTHEDRV
ncbi:LOW QUALITY PROTEIN: uncharacterized protein LOC144786025 [Lissotriton helveticus]